jgi:hypothetical protein
MSTPITVLFPVGRFVQGSMYKVQDKDYEGRPRIYPAGHPKAGQPKLTYFFAVAYPKAPSDNNHWANTEWGKQIWAFAHASWPAGQAQAPTFAWKIEDGDSAVPNKAQRRNIDREGFPGHWIVNYSSAFAPKLYTRDSSGRSQDLITPDAVKPGYFIQVQATIDSNATQGNPGIYINHSMVMLVGYGPEIRMGADPNAVTWATALPPGASATPVGGGTMPAPAAMPGAAPPPGGYAAPPGGAPPPPGGAPPAPSAAPTPVAPSTTFIGAPPAAAPPPPGGAPPPPPAAAGPQMTAKAAGQTFAAFIAAGWNEATLRAHGYIV